MSHILDDLPGVQRQYRPGEFLFHQGDVIVCMLRVITGEARLERLQENGSLTVLQRATAGSFLAEASLFAPRYHCSAIAGGNLAVKVIARTVMRKRFRDDPAFAEFWAEYLANEVRRARARAEILSLKRVAERLEAWIALNGEPHWHGSLKVLAEEIAVSPEALYREMARRRR